MISLRYFGYVLSALAIAACSGGSGDSAKTYSTSKFIDSAVEGLYYSGVPSGTVGTTAADGAFTYIAGDVVSFKIGGADGLDIGSSSPVDGVPVVVTDLPGGEQVAQILQTFSESANPGEKLNLSRVKFSANDVKTLRAHIVEKGGLDAFKANPEIAKITASVGEQLGKLLTIKSRADVESHLATSLASITTAPRFGDQLYLLIRAKDKEPQAFLQFTSADKSFRLFDNNFRKISGTFSQGASNLELKITTFLELQGSTYVDSLSTNKGCIFGIKELSNYPKGGTGSVVLRGFQGTPTGRSSCADPKNNDTGAMEQLVAAEIDTSFSLKDLSDKTLEAYVPRANGTGCKERVKFAFTPLTDYTLDVTATVDPTDTDECKATFDAQQVTLSFSRAKPEGDTEYAAGLFTLNIISKAPSSKYVTMFLMRPKYLNSPATAAYGANTVVAFVYADNTGSNGMEMKSASGDPAKLTVTPQ